MSKRPIICPEDMGLGRRLKRFWGEVRGCARGGGRWGEIGAQGWVLRERLRARGLCCVELWRPLPEVGSPFQGLGDAVGVYPGRCRALAGARLWRL